MSSAAKTVLLSYLEKNKRIVIPSEKSESDLRYLNNQFIAHFNFESNVKLDITFQRFESEWNEYILYTDEINNKDKLKVVVTPLLGGETPTRCISGSFKDKDEDKEVNFQLKYPKCLGLHKNDWWSNGCCVHMQ